MMADTLSSVIARVSHRQSTSYTFKAMLDFKLGSIRVIFHLVEFCDLVRFALG